MTASIKIGRNVTETDVMLFRYISRPDNRTMLEDRISDIEARHTQIRNKFLKVSKKEKIQLQLDAIRSTHEYLGMPNVPISFGETGRARKAHIISTIFIGTGMGMMTIGTSLMYGIDSVNTPLTGLGAALITNGYYRLRIWSGETDKKGIHVYANREDRVWTTTAHETAHWDHINRGTGWHSTSLREGFAYSVEASVSENTPYFDTLMVEEILPQLQSARKLLDKRRDTNIRFGDTTAIGVAAVMVSAQKEGSVVYSRILENNLATYN